MRKSIALAVLAVALSSCSVQTYTTLFDVRTPSKSGADIEGKTLSFVCLLPKEAEDSLFCISFADGFAQGLESKYYEGKRVLDVLSLKPAKGAEYACKDSMVNLVMETGSDVVMLMDIPEIEYAWNSDSLVTKVKVYLYDSMDDADVVRMSETSGTISNGTMLSSDAQMMGYNMSKMYVSPWKTEQFTFLYYDTLDSKWINSMYAVEDMDWQSATDIWLGLLDKYQGEQLSALEYNLATVCYLNKEFKLASQWLDKSDAEYPISLSKGLRKRIQLATLQE